MTSEEWATSDDAPLMLRALFDQQPDFFRTQVPQLHRYLIACCWKHQHLIPQKGLRNGLRGAERWIVGEITNEELYRLNWYAEAEAFAIDYAKTPEELAELRALIESINEIRNLPFEQARKTLLRAAYFAEMAMIYPTFRRLPWTKPLFTSDLLCADLLRECVFPHFNPG